MWSDIWFGPLSSLQSWLCLATRFSTGPKHPNHPKIENLEKQIRSTTGCWLAPNWAKSLRNFHYPHPGRIPACWAPGRPWEGYRAKQHFPPLWFPGYLEVSNILFWNVLDCYGEQYFPYSLDHSLLRTKKILCQILEGCFQVSSKLTANVGSIVSTSCSSQVLQLCELPMAHSVGWIGRASQMPRGWGFASSHCGKILLLHNIEYMPAISNGLFLVPTGLLNHLLESKNNLLESPGGIDHKRWWNEINGTPHWTHQANDEASLAVQAD